jgi:hypothetical protein
VCCRGPGARRSAQSCGRRPPASPSPPQRGGIGAPRTQLKPSTMADGIGQLFIDDDSCRSKRYDLIFPNTIQILCDKIVPPSKHTKQFDVDHKLLCMLNCTTALRPFLLLCSLLNHLVYVQPMYNRDLKLVTS